MTEKRAAIYHRTKHEYITESDLLTIEQLFTHAKEQGCVVVAARFETPNGREYEQLAQSLRKGYIDAIFLRDGDGIGVFLRTGEDFNAAINRLREGGAAAEKELLDKIMHDDR